ncbi:hypothetical protein VTJ83DRAFT_590 [Remersonia thermophila]|uniref:Uncharacterized protein n=1 Tax=Remersonia thermophila TaxID=72144 RepID=A0ABR4DM97_9PEZI
MVMRPSWGRLLAVLILVGGAIDVTQANPSSFGTSAAPVAGHAGSDPVPGTQALAGRWKRGWTIGKRDCLPNGSSYCFGNTVEFCPRCGTCCTGESKHCCDSGSVCCGTGCCPPGQTCSGGKCLPPVTLPPLSSSSSSSSSSSATTTLTLTSTVFRTLTHTVTQRTTVVVAQIETSTIISADYITISTAETQTDVVWATVTALYQRAVSTPHLARSREQQARARELLLPAALQSSREAEPEVAEGIAAVLRRRDGATVTVFVTTTVDIETTSTTAITTTVHTTSTERTTLRQTMTRVLSADTTITVTSTITLTPLPPSSVTITSTATPSPAPASASTTAASAMPSPTGEPGPSGTLPAGTIAGIAAGSTALAILLAGFIILSIRRRSRRRHDGDRHVPPDPSFDAYRASRSMDQRQPALPRILPHFAPASPAHHAEQFQPPTPYSSESSDNAGGGGGGGGARSRGASDASSHPRHGGDFHHQPRRSRDYRPPAHHEPQRQQQQQQRQQQQEYPPRSHHQRNSSGFTTLVGTPSPTTAAFGFKHEPTPPSPRRPHSPALSARERERAWWAELDGSCSRPSSRARSPVLGGGGGGYNSSDGAAAPGAKEQGARNGPRLPPAELEADRWQP